MPTTKKSPYATSFKSAIKRGVPCSTAVTNIAKRCNTTTNTVFNSLFKAGLCYRQKFNGQWIYWACEGTKTNATNCKSCQFDMWQSFIDWCICCGHCTPEQIKNHCGSQQEFMTWCKKFFNRQFNTMTTTKTTKRRRPVKSTTKKRTMSTSRTRGTSTSRNYRISSSKSGVTRRYRRAA